MKTQRVETLGNQNPQPRLSPKGPLCWSKSGGGNDYSTAVDQKIVTIRMQQAGKGLQAG
jgi:hypothetical protein